MRRPQLVDEIISQEVNGLSHRRIKKQHTIGKPQGNIQDREILRNVSEYFVLESNIA